MFNTRVFNPYTLNLVKIRLIILFFDNRLYTLACSTQKNTCFDGLLFSSCFVQMFAIFSSHQSVVGLTTDTTTYKNIPKKN